MLPVYKRCWRPPNVPPRGWPRSAHEELRSETTKFWSASRLLYNDSMQSSREKTVLQYFRLLGAKPLYESMLVCLLSNWSLRNKLQWNFSHNTTLFIHENASENIVCEMAAILSRWRLVKANLASKLNAYFEFIFFWGVSLIESPADHLSALRKK